MSADLGIRTQTTVRSDGQRRWLSALSVIAVMVVGFGLRPVAAQTCVGDCTGDHKVDIRDLILGVNIALGIQPVSACEAFADQNGKVNIAQLIQGVNDALNGCPGPPVTVTGSCAAPGTGNHGLKPCDAGTPIAVLRCDNRTQCLHQQGLTMLGATTVASGGGWSVQIPMVDASATLVFQASITKAVVYRTLAFGSVGASLRAGLAGDVTAAPVDITPVTEAGVQLLDNNGFQNYSDTGAQKVVTAVAQADANLSFADTTPDGAIALALQTASKDPNVMTVLQTAPNTPTATVTTTPTPTSTNTPASPFTGVFSGTYVFTAGPDKGETGQVTIVIGANGMAGLGATNSDGFAAAGKGVANLVTGAVTLTQLSDQLNGPFTASVNLKANGSSVTGSGTVTTDSGDRGTVTITARANITSNYVGVYLGTLNITAGPDGVDTWPIALFVANDGTAAGRTLDRAGDGFQFQGTVNLTSGAFTLALDGGSRSLTGVTGNLTGNFLSSTLANGTFDLSNGDTGTVSFPKVAP